MVLDAARRRAEQGTLGETGSLNVTLVGRERSDVGILLGGEWQNSERRPSLRALRRVLGSEYGVSLEELIVEVGGPIEDRVSARLERAEARRDARGEANRMLAAQFAPELAEAVAVHCLPARVAEKPLVAGDLVQVAAALDGLKSGELDREPVLLTVLAARCFGDAHALDRNHSFGRKAARMAMLMSRHGARGHDGRPPEAVSSADPVSAEGWRAAWAAVGVTCDRVSSTVLVLNLPLAGSVALETITSVPGEPVWLNVRLLEGASSVTLAGGFRNSVFVCENPSIVEAAADRLGVSSSPVICTFGKPSLAAFRLLRSLASSGVPLRIRADNDPAGRAIAASLFRACPAAEPWRYERGSPMYEEQLIDDLLADLAE